MLKFGDFAKLDVKIGTVVKCQKVAGTDRLLKIIIDFGDKKKQVVAGFGFKYQPQDLIGKQVPVVINIQPAEIKGVKSEGILLAIDDKGKPLLLLPEEKVSNGSKVR